MKMTNSLPLSGRPAYLAHEKRYIQLCRRFLAWQIDAAVFAKEFIVLRDWDREDFYWKHEQYECALWQAYKQGKLSEETFGQLSKRTCEAWTDHPFGVMIECIYLGCSNFAPDPELDWEINAERLRLLVTNALAEYNRCKKRLSMRKRLLMLGAHLRLFRATP